MSEQPAPSSRRPNANVIRARFQKLSVSNRGGALGPAEIIALAGSFFILFLVVVGYLYFQMPARSRLATLQVERARIQTQLRNSQNVVLQSQSTENAAQHIAQSLDVFENIKLLTASRGRISLYDALHDLIRKNGLRNTSGPTYTPLDAAGTKTTTGGTKANTKWQTIYPGVAVSVTVEGPYQNLRRFVRDLETTKQFVIINAVELERSSETNVQPAEGEESGSGPRNSAVSLRLDMATYFQRGSDGGGSGEQ
jgi:Tfp pilus assembly protein PilO